MTAALLLREFQRIADEPDSIERLRRFVFALSMRGKLSGADSPQVDVYGIPHRPTQPRKAPADPYELPREWRWSTTAEIGTARLGKMLDKAKNRGTPRRYLRNINVRWFDFDLSDVKVMPFEDAELSEFALRAGDVLICEGGEPGRAAVWDARESDVYFQKAVHRVRLNPEVLPLFLVYYLRSAAYEGRLAPHATGTTFQHLTGQSLATLPVPIPPIDEQRHIVTRVCELMGLCDELNAAQTERETRRDRCRTISLRNLVASDESKDYARFFLQHSPRMITKPEHVAGVRQAILDLAVRGRLVPQNGRDEPAATLLKQITARPSEPHGIQRMTRLNSISHPPAVSNPFPLPIGWEWTSLASVCTSITDGDHQPPPQVDDGVPFLVIGNILKVPMDLQNCRHVSTDYYSALASIRRPQQGDILYTLVGTLGRPVAVTQSAPFCVQRHVGILRPDPAIPTPFLTLVLRSDFAFQQAHACATGIGQKTVPLSGLRRFAVSLPPLAEQHRIVAKVDELMTVCDALEWSLSAEQTERRLLLEALLHDALQDGLPGATSRAS